MLIMGTFHTSASDKMKWEELVANHLESIGTAEARTAVKVRAMNGRANVFFRLGSTGQLSGDGSILSKGRMVRFAMNFGHPAYPGEHYAFDGTDVTVDTLKPNQRSNLSQFLYENSFLLKEGLIGGAISTSWSLLEVKERNPELKYKGLKKIEGRELHELEYKARKGEKLMQVNLYFQQDTFRHVMSKYVLRIPADMGFTPEGSSQPDAYVRLTEEFDDFRQVDGLTLPHQYKLVFSNEGLRPTVLIEYDIEAAQILHNVPVDPQAFKIR
jgi:hypothetical protein